MRRGPDRGREVEALLKTVVVLTVTLVVNYFASLATILITLRLV
ncbi:MAG TPA: hypothetical protein VES67_14890 [Vicinamibacterales bacterium]|nr:hypothetical protein [Vicinamibacterales bacterium]